MSCGLHVLKFDGSKKQEDLSNDDVLVAFGLSTHVDNVNAND